MNDPMTVKRKNMSCYLLPGIKGLLYSLLLLACKKDEKPMIDFSGGGQNNGNGNTQVEVPALANSQRPILICEQAQSRVIIVDSASQGIMWEWKPASALPASQAAWFREIDEAKPVYNKKYILVTASSGGAALVRVADKKIMFYANVKGSPHSAELLPDGNIVVACSTSGTADGDALKIYQVDSLHPMADRESFRLTLSFGHNVVWDRKRNCLWATDQDYLYTFTYNNDGSNPQLTPQPGFVAVPDDQPHDLFPVYGQDALRLTTASNIYEISPETGTFTRASFSMPNIKSVSAGPAGFGTILMKPTESWWSDGVINSSGGQAFRSAGLKIYKARWFVDNLFSYPAEHVYTQTK